MPSDIPRGRFVWYDLMTTNPAAAVSFYTATVGWGTEQWKGPEGAPPYTMWTASGSMIGGVMQLPDAAQKMGAPPHWIGYVAVPNVDETVGRTTELGGKVMMQPMVIPTVGTTAVLNDPQGALIADFTPEGSTPGHDGAAKIGEFSWHELATTDVDAALAFYQTLFGWDKLTAMDTPMGIYQMFGRNGQPMGGIYKTAADRAMPPNWLYYARVNDVDGAKERAESNGGKVLNGPMEVPGGDRVVMCQDPQGAYFAMHWAKNS
jgi:predicted enzyme related to lactoylglutathione lyase